MGPARISPSLLPAAAAAAAAAVAAASPVSHKAARHFASLLP